MKIAIVGIGYVGLVSAACFADLGVEVYCVDIDEKKINDLKKGIVPIYEPGLKDIIKRCSDAGRLLFTTSLDSVVNDVEIIFIAVGTPESADGAANLSYVFDVAKSIGDSMSDYKLIVNKSTVPVGTASEVKKMVRERLDKRNLKVDFDVASNPEFLKEGNAIDDFTKPDRVVVGVESDRAKDLMTKLYKPMLLNNFRVMFMDVASAEMSKYASNTMLATRISFMNQIASLCEKVGADVNKVRAAMGADSRIGSKFLYAGCGYGGSCFPKDVRAIINTAKSVGVDMSILREVDKVNENQKKVLFDKLYKYYLGDLSGKKIAIWGLSFKPETDDMREAPSLELIKLLSDAGCLISVYDPIAIDEAKRILSKYKNIIFAKDIYDTVVDSDALIHVTEWKEFRMPSWNVIYKLMKKPILIDGRNVFDSSILKDYGIEYIGIGRPIV